MNLMKAIIRSLNKIKLKQKKKQQRKELKGIFIVQVISILGRGRWSREPNLNVLIGLVAWENRQHFAMPPTVSLQNDMWEMSAEIPY